LVYRVVYKYPLGYVPQDREYNEINISYDAENILQKFESKYGDGSVEITTFAKTPLSFDNYQLAWSQISYYHEDSIYRKVEFDKDDRPIINYIEHFYFSPFGDTSKTTIADSLIYNAGGSVTKVFRRIENNQTNTIENFTLYEYTRQTKGDQLYGQRLTLMNGLANIPLSDYDYAITDPFGVLSFSLDYESLLYSNYPITSVKARMWDGSFKNFTSSPTLDDKNRLTKFTGFFHDLDMEPVEYRISYFK
jgi:hypothetical protein